MNLVFAAIFSLFVLMSPQVALAISDPLAVPNNKIGIHILFPSEMDKANQLVNNDSQASWGYVVIPIQASDRNRDKWQSFFDDCVNKKIIPIIRVATVPQGKNWQAPDPYDLIDFANFLDGLKWPTKNRYVIIFNEVNRSDEYGGFVNPEEYTQILANAAEIFKSKSQDFFILPSALDNAAVNTKFSLSPSTYLYRMYQTNKDVFNMIDGWNSHAYPNPDFSSRPDKSGINKIDSFRHDLKILSKYTNKKLPVFITETGWSTKYLTEEQIEYYYKYAFEKVWNDPNIVTVAPFLLNAQDGPFKVFSFQSQDGQFKKFAKYISSLATRGEPQLPEPAGVTPPQVAAITPPVEVPITTEDQNSFQIVRKLYQNLIKILNLRS